MYLLLQIKTTKACLCLFARLYFMAGLPVTGAGTGRKLLYEDTQTASFSGGAAAQQGSDSAAYQSTQSAPAGNTANAAASNQAAAVGNTWQDALGTIQRSATAAFNANNNVPVQQQQQQV